MPKTVPCQVLSSGGRRSWSLMAALSRIANKVLQSTFPGLKIFFDFMVSFSFTVQKFFVLSEIRIPLTLCCSFRNKKCCQFNDRGYRTFSNLCYIVLYCAVIRRMFGNRGSERSCLPAERRQRCFPLFRVIPWSIVRATRSVC